MSQDPDLSRISSSVLREQPELTLTFRQDGEAIILFPNGTKLRTRVVPNNADRALATEFFASSTGQSMIMQLHEEAIHDSLTGLLRRAPAQAMINEQLKRMSAMRFEGVVSVMALDLDHFKKVNDEYGHTTGDKVLQWFAEIIRRSTRIIDVSARWGGEEFIIFAVSRKPAELSDSREQDKRTTGMTVMDSGQLLRSGRILADRICTMAHGFPCVLGDTSIRQTVTIAVASQYLTPEVSTEGLFDFLYEHADAELIKQKHLGERNQVHAAPLFWPPSCASP